MSDPRLQPLVEKAREAGWNDLEVMGLRRLTKQARKVGATPDDIKENLQKVSRQCRMALGNPNISGEDVAARGICNELIQPPQNQSRQTMLARTLDGVFTKRIAQSTRMRAQRGAKSDLFMRSDNDAIAAERLRNKRNIQGESIMSVVSSLGSVFTGDKSVSETISELIKILAQGIRSMFLNVFSTQTPMELVGTLSSYTAVLTLLWKSASSGYAALRSIVVGFGGGVEAERFFNALSTVLAGSSLGQNVARQLMGISAAALLSMITPQLISIVQGVSPRMDEFVNVLRSGPTRRDDAEPVQASGEDAERSSEFDFDSF